MAAVRRDARMPGMHSEGREARLVMAASFMVFLVVAACARCVAWRWRPWPPGPGGYRSVVQEARRAARTFVPYAYTY